MVNNDHYDRSILQEIDSMFDGIEKRYKDESAAETKKAFYDSKKGYKTRMSAVFDGNEHMITESKLRDLHIKNWRICADEFKSKAAHDLCSENMPKLEEVCSLLDTKILKILTKFCAVCILNRAITCVKRFRILEYVVSFLRIFLRKGNIRKAWKINSRLKKSFSRRFADFDH
jgi:hypothetical protein